MPCDAGRDSRTSWRSGRRVGRGKIKKAHTRLQHGLEDRVGRHRADGRQFAARRTPTQGNTAVESVRTSRQKFARPPRCLRSARYCEIAHSRPNAVASIRHAACKRRGKTYCASPLRRAMDTIEIRHAALADELSIRSLVLAACARWGAHRRQTARAAHARLRRRVAATRGLGNRPASRAGTLRACTNGPKLRVHQHRFAPRGAARKTRCRVRLSQGSRPGNHEHPYRTTYRRTVGHRSRARLDT